MFKSWSQDAIIIQKCLCQLLSEHGNTNTPFLIPPPPAN